MLAQQLQDPREPARAGRRAVMPFQDGTEAGEAAGELPIAEDRRVVQRPGLAAQRREIIEFIGNSARFQRKL